MRTIRDEDASGDPGVELQDVTVVRCTAKAALYSIDDGDDIWLPHSAIHDNSELYYDESAYEMSTRGPATLVVTTYWAEKKGIV